MFENRSFKRHRTPPNNFLLRIDTVEMDTLLGFCQPFDLTLYLINGLSGGSMPVQS